MGKNPESRIQKPEWLGGWARLALTACLAAGVVCGQGFPLEKLTVEGNDDIPTARIEAALGLKMGQAVAERDFNAARDRLLATGAFESVGFEYKPSAAGTGFEATFQVVEVAPLYAYRFEALGKIDAVLREVLRQQEPIFGDRIPATPQVMNRYSAALAKFLNDGVEVQGEINADLPGRIEIVFRPAGARSNISGVFFSGNQILPAEQLMGAMAGVAIGVPYSEPLFLRMLDQTLRPIYEERGRVRLSFPRVDTAKSSENEGVDVTVTVNEGASYTLGTVKIEGVPEGQVADLNRQAAWQTGEIANFTEVRAGLDRIRKGFHEQGYLRAEAKVTRDIDDAAHVVNLAVDIEPGARYSMGTLTIKGLDILSEPAIRKAWALPEGAPYRDGYADQFVKRAMDEGWFDNLKRTGAEAEIHDDALTVDVILTFEGGKVVPENQRVPGQR